MNNSLPPDPKAPRPSDATAVLGSSDHDALQQRYPKLELLGEGGSASVFRAFDAVRDRWVALKRLKQNLDARAREQAKLMLETEYHTLRQLQHPSIIEVYEYGIDRDLGPYYTMELLSGQDLQTLSPLPWRDACRLLMGIASSLAVIHSRRLVHRDVSSRNVRLTADDSAKLLDFGALTPMGVVKRLVGTPPFVPPEALHQQELDGRSDLYALGALAYFAISGRHAYPARDFGQLRQLWHSPPPSLRVFQADVPEALSELVLSLLDADMLSRPQSAAEVMARLSAIADLPLIEADAVQHAYLTAPRLVAREAPLVQVRTHILRALRGQPSALLISGPMGMGRSRMLNVCVLEAELAGAVVLRADATDGATPFGVTRRLVQRVIEARPALRARATELGLDPLIAEAGVALPRRDVLIANTLQLLLRASARQLLVIAVDDAHAIDEPSLALLASLSEAVRTQRLVLLLSHSSDAPMQGTLAWNALNQSAHPLPLTPLSSVDTRNLLASVFGEVPRLDMLSALIHRSSAGNPREIMDAAQRACDAQLVRYSGGQWFIADEPERIAACLDRPTDVGSRLAQLSAAGRELLSLLSLDRDHRLGEADYSALCAEHDPASLHFALNDLLRERWLVRADTGHRFVRVSDQHSVAAELSRERTLALHVCIAQHLHACQRDPVYEVYHFVEGAQAQHAHDAMARYLDMADKNPQRMRAAIELDTVERLVAVGAAQAWPLPLLTLYRTQIMMLAAAFGSWERALPHAAVTLRALAELAGLDDYHALTQLPAAERLPSAFKAAQSRFASAPEGSHPLPPINAVRALTRVSTVAAAAAYWMTQPDAFDQIPSLTPLVPLSAALGLTERIVLAFRALARGQEWTGWDAFNQLYLDVCAMPETQLDARNRYTLELVVLSPVCFRAARHAAASTLSHCAALAPKQADAAQNYAMLYHLAVGDAVATERAREQCETSLLRAGATGDTRSTRLQVSVIVLPLMDDMMGLKQLSRELDAMREHRPGWRFSCELIAAHVLRCQGKLGPALDTIERALAELPEAHLDFAPCAQAHVQILTQLGQLERARERALHYLERARTLKIPTAWLELELAQCLSRLDQHVEAEHSVEQVLAAFREREIGGVHLGYAYEVGARLARARDDHDSFQALARHCAELYLPGRHPALAAKYRRLIAELDDAAAFVGAAASAGHDAVHSALSQCADRTQRAEQASAILREHAQLRDAILFGVRAGQLEPLNTTAPMSDAVLNQVRGYVRDELEADELITRTAATGVLGAIAADVGADDVNAQVEIEGRAYTPVLLRARGERGTQIVGVALLLAGADEMSGSYQALLPNLASALLAFGDVEPLS